MTAADDAPQRLTLNEFATRRATSGFYVMLYAMQSRSRENDTKLQRPSPASARHKLGGSPRLFTHLLEFDTCYVNEPETANSVLKPEN